MLTCMYCNRRFDEEALDRHERNCTYRYGDPGEDMIDKCICPLVWNGHNEPKPDPKRRDPNCRIHK